MSRFEDIPVHGEFPALIEGDVAIDFTLIHGEGEGSGVEKFTFSPRKDRLDIPDYEQPEEVRSHLGKVRVMFGVLTGQGPVEGYEGEFPGSSSYIESVKSEHNSTNHFYTYKLKRAEAEFGIGNTQPGHLVICKDTLSFYPKDTHPKTKEAVISGAILALGGIYAIVRRKRDKTIN